MIKFGTSGHRGIINDSFTKEHVIAISHSIADFLLSKSKKPKIVIGTDPRDGNSLTLESESFTEKIVTTLINRGVDVVIFNHYCPTPAVSWYIKEKKYSGGLILTASHNPPSYNGIKFNPDNGAPAPKEITEIIEQKANEYLLSNDTSKTKKLGTLTISNCINEFSNSLVELCKNLTFKDTNLKDLKIAIDSKHGTSGVFWEKIYKKFNNNNLRILNKEPLSNFGNKETNPTKTQELKELKNLIINHNYTIGIANDPDADRHIILDEKGIPLTPEETALIIIEYAVSQNWPLYGIATTVASSRRLKEACSKYKLNFLETSVGFKYFAPFFEESQKNKKIAFGIESSGGFSISTHTFEKCGFLPALLLSLIINQYKQSLSTIKSNTLNQYTQSTFLEDELTLTNEIHTNLKYKIKQTEKTDLQPLFKNKIQTINKQDGLKIVFKNNDWILIRLSGTEPVCRIYSESNNLKNSRKLINIITQFLNH